MKRYPAASVSGGSWSLHSLRRTSLILPLLLPLLLPPNLPAETFGIPAPKSTGADWLKGQNNPFYGGRNWNTPPEWIKQQGPLGVPNPHSGSTGGDFVSGVAETPGYKPGGSVSQGPGVRQPVNVVDDWMAAGNKPNVPAGPGVRPPESVPGVSQGTSAGSQWFKDMKNPFKGGGGKIMGKDLGAGRTIFPINGRLTPFGPGNKLTGEAKGIYDGLIKDGFPHQVSPGGLKPPAPPVTPSPPPAISGPAVSPVGPPGGAGGVTPAPPAVIPKPPLNPPGPGAISHIPKGSSGAAAGKTGGALVAPKPSPSPSVPGQGGGAAAKTGMSTAGKVLIGVMAINSLINIATSENPGQQAKEEGRSWATGILGNILGGLITGGPIGGFIGAVVGVTATDKNFADYVMGNDQDYQNQQAQSNIAGPKLIEGQQRVQQETIGKNLQNFGSTLLPPQTGTAAGTQDIGGYNPLTDPGRGINDVQVNPGQFSSKGGQFQQGQQAPLNQQNTTASQAGSPTPTSPAAGYTAPIGKTPSTSGSSHGGKSSGGSSSSGSSSGSSQGGSCSGCSGSSSSSY